VIDLLTALSSAKKVMHELEEYDDYDVIELLEMKYEKIFKQLAKQ
jgi:hypothetical protein